MKVFRFLNKYKYIFIPAILSVICFFGIYGFDVINPLNVEWIMAKGGDITQHYIGWEFFRRSPWTFPIGTNSIGAYPFGFSVIFTDSIPLFAVIFKLFSGVLPEYFQYIGIYGLLCYILQGITSAIVLKKFIKNDYLVSIISVFFIMCPVVLDRMFHHTALVSHYLIMIGYILVLYKDKFSLKKITLFWGLLAFLSVFTHIYILLFNGIILLGYMLYEYLSSKNLKRVFYPFASFMMLGLISTFALGGFAVPSSPVGVSALGLFSFNLNGFFNAFGLSRILPMFPFAPNTLQDEGFAYLGFGVLIAFCIAMFISVLIITYKFCVKKQVNFNKHLLISMVFVAIVSIICATAKSIYFGDKLLFQYSLPYSVEAVLGVFRSNGRIIWVLYYIVVFMTIYILYRAFKKRFFIFLIILLLGIQIYDLSYMMIWRHGEVNQAYEPVILDERWDKLFSEDFSNVILPSDFPGYLEYMYNLDLYVIKYDKTINRSNIAQDMLNPVILEELNNSLSNLNDKDLYIIDPFAYMRYKDYDMNYYFMDKLYIATTRELPYLDKVNSEEVVFVTNKYSKFQFKEYKNYVIIAEAKDGFVGDAIDYSTLAGCKLELKDDILYIYVSNMSEVEIEINNDMLVKYTVKEIEVLE